MCLHFLPDQVFCAAKHNLTIGQTSTSIVKSYSSKRIPHHHITCNFQLPQLQVLALASAQAQAQAQALALALALPQARALASAPVTLTSAATAFSVIDDYDTGGRTQIRGQ